MTPAFQSGFGTGVAVAAVVILGLLLLADRCARWIRARQARRLADARVRAVFGAIERRYLDQALRAQRGTDMPAADERKQWMVSQLLVVGLRVVQKPAAGAA